MSSVNSSIQPLVWFPNGLLPDHLRYVSVLRMSPVLPNILRSMGKTEANTAPISSLHDLLASASRSIIAFQPGLLRAESSTQSWMYLRKDHAVDTERLKSLISAWLLINDETHGQTYTKVIQGINWSWESVVDLQMRPDLRKLLLPGLVARWLLEQDTLFQFPLTDPDHVDGEPLYLVPLMSGRGYAELITAPQPYRSSAYAYVLRLWMEDVPLKGPALFARASIRRWYTRSLLSPTGWPDIKYNHNKSVYLRQETGYLDNEDEPTTVFSRIRMRHYKKGETRLHWVGNQTKVFRQMSFGDGFPDAAVLAQNPLEYQDRFLLTKTAGAKDEAQTGLWSNDHRSVFHALNAVLTQWATLVPVWPREPKGDPSHLGKTVSQKPQTDIPANLRFAALQTLPAPIRIILHIERPELAKEVILKEIGVWDRYKDRLKENPLRICLEDTPNSPCVVEIALSKDVMLTSLLRNPKNDKAVYSGATQIRIAEIQKRTQRAEKPSGYLIGLPRYDQNPKEKWLDPKVAIRQGLIQQGYVSQFFDSEAKENAAHRLTNSVRDLLRALGFRVNPLYTKPAKSALPDHLDILALTVIQLNARGRDEKKVFLPIVLEVPSDNTEFRVFLPDRNSTSRLNCSLYDAACDVVRDDVNTDFADPDAMIPFFRGVLRERRGNRPALLILADQNMRRVFPELESQYVDLSDGVLGTLLTTMHDVRVARLRYSFHDEAPLCIPPEERSKYQGLYTHPAFPNVYYSLHNVGDTHVFADASKFDSPDDAAVNPSTMQILLHNLQDGDDAAEWAGLIHRLRLESSHIDRATRYPQPLHNLDKITEYLVLYDDESEATTEDNTDEPEMEL